MASDENFEVRCNPIAYHCQLLFQWSVADLNRHKTVNYVNPVAEYLFMREIDIKQFLRHPTDSNTLVSINRVIGIGLRRWAEEGLLWTFADNVEWL